MNQHLVQVVVTQSVDVKLAPTELHGGEFAESVSLADKNAALVSRFGDSFTARTSDKLVGVLACASHGSLPIIAFRSVYERLRDVRVFFSQLQGIGRDFLECVERAMHRFC